MSRDRTAQKLQAVDTEQRDLASLAVAGELARQLCHEFSNFLYNLMLQAEIGLAGPAPQGWDSMKLEGRKLTRLLQEWEVFHKRFTFTETSVDIHAVIRQLAQELAASKCRIELAPKVSAGPLCVRTSLLDCRHLLLLLAEDLLRSWRRREAEPTLTIGTENAHERAIIRLIASVGDGECVEPAGADGSLLESACRSLAVRLGANLEREPAERGRSAVWVEFPLN